MKFILHQGLNREQDVAIRIVEQIKRCEDDQRSARIKFRLGHRSSEYSTLGRLLWNYEPASQLHYPVILNEAKDSLQTRATSASIGVPNNAPRVLVGQLR